MSKNEFSGSVSHTNPIDHAAEQEQDAYQMAQIEKIGNEDKRQ
jgi:hypothetical protein